MSRWGVGGGRESHGFLDLGWKLGVPLKLQRGPQGTSVVA